MAAFNFPNSPSTNDLHTENNVTWKWNGTVWKRINNSYLTASTLDITGISTLTGGINVGTAGTISSAGNITLDKPGAGIITATKYYGDGSTLSNITSTTINNNANDRIITGSGTANTLEAETSLEWDGTDTLKVVHASAYPDFRVEHSAGGGTFESFRCGNGPFRIKNTTQSFYSAADELAIGSGSGDRGLTIYSGSSDSGVIAFADGTSDPAYRMGQIIYGHGDNSMTFRTNGNTERLRIDSSGRLLINNTASNTMWGYGQGSLQVTGNWDEASASFINDEANANSHAITLAKIRGSSIVNSGDTCGAIAWNGYDGSAYKPTARIMGVVDGTPGSGDMPGRLVFETTADGGSTPTERLRITSSGDISISGNGTIHGVSKLTIKPANRTTAFAASDGDTWHDVVIKHEGDATNNAVGLAFEVSGDAYHKNAGTGIAAVKQGTATDFGSDLVFITRGQSTAATEKARLLSSGGLTFNGDTAAANALDDYEEGSFTPVFNGSDGGGTSRSGTGKYTKVGNVVNCWVDLSNANGSSFGSGFMKVTGLPFTCTQQSWTTNIWTYNVAFNTSRIRLFYMSSGGTAINGYYSVNDGTWQPWYISEWDASQLYVRFHITYQA